MRKIIVIVSLVLVVILASLVTLSLVLKRDYSLNLENPDTMVIYKDGTSMGVDADGQAEIYNDILCMLDNAAETTYMNAFLTGDLTKENDLVTVTSSSLALNATDKVFIRFNYFAEGNLMINGTQYVNTLTENPATYYSIVFEITEADQMSEVTVYVTSSNSDTFYTNYRYTTYLNTSAIYDYVEALYIP